MVNALSARAQRRQRERPDTPGHLRMSTLTSLFRQKKGGTLSVLDLECDQCPYAVRDLDTLKGYKGWRMVLHMTMEKVEYSTLATIVSWSVLACIALSTVGFVLETEPALAHLSVWYHIETIVTVIFTVEYVLRFVSCKDIFRFLFTFLNIIDLVSILPFYVELTGLDGGDETGLRVVRVIRLVRVFRLFKNPRLKVFLNVLTVTFHRSSDSFGLVISLLLLVVVVFSGLVYYVEKGTYDAATGLYLRDDGVESDFKSILGASWWCMETITTVGYGDVVPVTPIGRVIASVAMLTGIMVLAFPVVIIGTNFDGVYMEFKEAKAASELESCSDKANKRSTMRYVSGVHREELFANANEVMMNIHQKASTGRQILESIDALSAYAHLLIDDDEGVDGDSLKGVGDGAKGVGDSLHGDHTGDDGRDGAAGNEDDSKHQASQENGGRLLELDGDMPRHDARGLDAPPQFSQVTIPHDRSQVSNANKHSGDHFHRQALSPMETCGTEVAQNAKLDTDAVQSAHFDERGGGGGSSAIDIDTDRRRKRRRRPQRPAGGGSGYCLSAPSSLPSSPSPVWRGSECGDEDRAPTPVLPKQKLYGRRVSKVDLFVPPHLFKNRRSSAASVASCPLPLPHTDSAAQTVPPLTPPDSAARTVPPPASSRMSSLRARLLRSKRNGMSHSDSNITARSSVTSFSQTFGSHSAPRSSISSVGSAHARDSASSAPRSSLSVALETLRRSDQRRLETVRSPRCDQPEEDNISPEVQIPVASAKNTTKPSVGRASSFPLSAPPAPMSSSPLRIQKASSMREYRTVLGSTHSHHPPQYPAAASPLHAPRNRPDPVDTSQVRHRRRTLRRPSFPRPFKRERSLSDAFMSLGKGPPVIVREPSLVEFIVKARVERAKRASMQSRYERGRMSAVE